MDIDPQYVDALTNFDTVYLNLKEYDQAKEYYEKALEIEPENIHALTSLSNFYVLTQNYEEAHKYIQVSLPLEEIWEQLANWGHIEFCKGNISRALELYLQSATLANKNKELDAYVEEYHEDAEIIQIAGADAVLYTELLNKVLNELPGSQNK